MWGLIGWDVVSRWMISPAIIPVELRIEKISIDFSAVELERRAEPGKYREVDWRFSLVLRPACATPLTWLTFISVEWKNRRNCETVRQEEALRTLKTEDLALWMCSYPNEETFACQMLRNEYLTRTIWKKAGSGVLRLSSKFSRVFSERLQGQINHRA